LRPAQTGPASETSWGRRGKLTNALLGLSASCEATGQRSSLCALADQAVVQTGWSMALMDTTAHQVLELIQAPKAP